MQNCSHLSPVFTWLWPAFLSGLSLKPEVTGLTTNSVTVHYSGRKQVNLQIFEFIGATVNEFHFLIVV